MSAHRARRGAVVGLAVALALLTACAEPAEPGRSPEGEQVAPDDAFPVTIEHALGTTVVEEAPERVVTLGWASQDTALALGVVPVGIAQDTWAGDPETGLLPWTQDAIDELRGGSGQGPVTFVDSPEVDVEEVAALEPDLVLATYSGISQDVYDQLSELVPVVAYPDQPWLVSAEEQTLTNGRALGLEGEAEELLEGMEALVAQTAAEHPDLAGTTFAYAYTDPDGALSVYVEGDPRVDLITALGLELAPGVAGLEAPEGSFFVDLGTESTDVLHDADVLITWFNDETEQQAVESLGTFQAIPAVQRGTYLPVLDRQLSIAMSTSTALSLPWGLEEFVPQLVEAAEE